METLGAASKINVLERGKSVREVIKDICQTGQFDEPFYILDVGDLVRKHNEWKLQLPRVRPFYAVKCNENRNVLEVLASLGVNFDCASKNEIAKMLELGVDPERIIYANSVKQVSHIRYASAANVKLMTFDNESELYKVKKHHPTAKMVLRIRCDAKKAQFSLGDKFGVLPKDAPHLIALCHQLGIDLVGISFHVGTGCGEPDVFRRAISSARDMFDLATDYGYTLNLVDLGGGYPGSRDSSIAEIASIINTALDQFFPEGCGVDVIAEPGRYYVESAFTLATNIHGRRKVIGDDSTITYEYYINVGVHGGFCYVSYDHDEATAHQVESRGGLKHASTIWGPTCDSTDFVMRNVQLPVMEVGDWIIFENMGAYTLTSAETFNGFPIPTVFPVALQHTWRHLKDLLPLGPAYFTMESPLDLIMGCTSLVNPPSAKSCFLELPNSSLDAVNAGRVWQVEGREPNAVLLETELSRRDV